MFKNENLKAGAGAVEIKADDSMVIGGGIFAAYLSGQEGKLRASAVVIEKDIKTCIVSCDVLMTERDILDQACGRIESETGIVAENILICSTHTHHAPTTVTVHGYERDELFCERLKDGIVEAVRVANENLEESRCYFAVGELSDVGQNSRVVLDDGSVLWVPLEQKYAAFESTGSFDSELAVFAFKSLEGKLCAMIFNHSTHNIGSCENKRSPGFYVLASQQLEDELGGTVLFVPGASGSTHNLTLSADEMVGKVKGAIEDVYSRAEEIPVDKIRVLKKEISYKVREFDEAEEERAVSYYCNKMRVDWCERPEDMVEVFRKMRQSLKGQQGQVRKSWLEVIALGNKAIVAVPGELFGKLGSDIKSRSPFKHTYIIGYANDHIGYIPDEKAYDLGGYQVWTGFHSVVERGFGEELVAESLAMLEELKNSE